MSRLSMQRTRARRRGLEPPPLPVPSDGSPPRHQRPKGWYKAERERLGEKRCSACKVVKKLVAFWVSDHTKDGYEYRCKDCSATMAHDYNQNNREGNVLRKQRQRLNPHVRAREAIATAQWKKDHPDETSAHAHSRRARKMRSPINDLTGPQWKAIKSYYGNRCVYCPPDCQDCKKKIHVLTQDHLTPLSKGGPHTYTNIVPACVSCNSKKWAKSVPKPVQPLLLL